MAGKGSDTTLTNFDNGHTLRVPGSGTGSLTTTKNSDGSFTDRLFGSNFLFLFPTDITAGPSTTLYTGSVVFTSDPDGRFTVLSTSGKSRNICAELA